MPFIRKPSTVVPTRAKVKRTRVPQPQWLDRSVATARAVGLMFWYRLTLQEATQAVVMDDRFCLNTGSAGVPQSWVRTVTESYTAEVLASWRDQRRPPLSRFQDEPEGM
jgi:hypothetical protein